MSNVIPIQRPAAGHDYSDWLPNIVRILEITRKTTKSGLVENHARVKYGLFDGHVSWISQHADIRLKHGVLAKVEWPARFSENTETITIIRLVHLESAQPNLNPFETIPKTWVNDQTLIARVNLLWKALPQAYQSFLGELFWDSARFYRFLTAPSSLNGHHNTWNGNFSHAVEVAERALCIAKDVPGVSEPLLVLASLIHDAGKADEYRWNDRAWVRTDAGSLVGHKDLLKAWMGAVFERKRDILPVAIRNALWHTLFSARNAPAYLDVRESCMLEADILSMADRLSGTIDLHVRAANTHGGFGTRHEHLKARPYRLPNLS
jgi:3'-5' exoribonuclease